MANCVKRWCARALGTQDDEQRRGAHVFVEQLLRSRQGLLAHLPLGEHALHQPQRFAAPRDAHALG